MACFRWLFGQPYLLLSLTALCWGGNAVAGKMAVGHVSPFILTMIRWMIAMAITLPFALPHLKRDWATIKPRLPFLFMLGAVGFAIFNNMMYLALNYTTAINVAIVQASMPLIVFVFNFLFFSIRAQNGQIFGFLLTLCGVTLITVGGSWHSLINFTFNSGDLLMLAAIMFYGIYSVLLRNKPDIHWLSMIAVLGVSAMITSVPFAAYEQLNSTAIWPDTYGLLVILYTAIFPSLVAQVCWIRGLEIIGSNAGGIFINLVPIIGTGLAILILGEKLHLHHLVAMVLVIGGVWFAQQRVRKIA